MRYTSEDIDKCYELIKSLSRSGRENIDFDEDCDIRKLRQINRACKYVDTYQCGDSITGYMDSLITPLVIELNESGKETIFSCEGHMESYPYIGFNGFISPECFSGNNIQVSYFLNIAGQCVTFVSYLKIAKSYTEHLETLGLFGKYLLSLDFTYVTSSVDIKNYPLTVALRETEQYIEVDSISVNSNTGYVESFTMKNGTTLSNEKIKELVNCSTLVVSDCRLKYLVCKTQETGNLEEFDVRLERL